LGAVKFRTGDRAGDLPVQQPIKFGLAINLKTPMALDITIPPSVLATAHKVIERSCYLLRCKSPELALFGSIVCRD